MSPLAKGLGGGAAFAFGDIRDWLFPNPADKAMGPLDEIPGQISPHYKPYEDAGAWAMPQLQKNFGEMMNDPNAIISRLGSGYKESPAFQYQMNKGENAINNSNAAGGMLGTGQHQQMAGQFANDLASEDYDKYLNHALGLYGAGNEGAMGLGKMGQQAGSDLATNLAQTLMSKSNLLYAGGANQNNMTGNLLNSIISALGKSGGAGA